MKIGATILSATCGYKRVHIDFWLDDGRSHRMTVWIGSELGIRALKEGRGAEVVLVGVPPKPKRNVACAACADWPCGHWNECNRPNKG